MPRMNTLLRAALASFAALILIGCADSSAQQSKQAHRVEVFKNASCGCCEVWVEHLRAAGFVVTTRDVDNLDPIKQAVGVPVGRGSCHTAKVDGYFVEGHVPAREIQRLLRERPAAKGLVVPAMPIGSPGMESPTGEAQAYDVLVVEKTGETRVYAHYPGSR
jgi:hypothetical protein